MARSRIACKYTRSELVAISKAAEIRYADIKNAESDVESDDNSDVDPVDAQAVDASVGQLSTLKASDLLVPSAENKETLEASLVDKEASEHEACAVQTVNVHALMKTMETSGDLPIVSPVNSPVGQSVDPSVDPPVDMPFDPQVDLPVGPPADLQVDQPTQVPTELLCSQPKLKSASLQVQTEGTKNEVSAKAAFEAADFVVAFSEASGFNQIFFDDTHINAKVICVNLPDPTKITPWTHTDLLLLQGIVLHAAHRLALGQKGAFICRGGENCSRTVAIAAARIAGLDAMCLPLPKDRDMLTVVDAIVEADAAKLECLAPFSTSKKRIRA